MHSDKKFNIENILQLLKDESPIHLKNKINDLRKKDPNNPVFLGVGLLGLLHGTGLRETAHTRLLAWILNPKENHGFEDKPLKNFLELCELDYDGKDRNSSLKDVSVKAEAMISNAKKRMDITIGKLSSNGGNYQWQLVVEVKIDQEIELRQLQSYEELMPKAKYILITPESEHKEYVKKYARKWTHIDVNDLIACLWNAIRDGKDESQFPGYHIMRYYISGVMSDVLEWDMPFKSSTVGYIYDQLNYIDQFLRRTI